MGEKRTARATSDIKYMQCYNFSVLCLFFEFKWYINSILHSGKNKNVHQQSELNWAKNLLNAVYYSGILLTNVR
jgi:hypothetical protein